MGTSQHNLSSILQRRVREYHCFGTVCFHLTVFSTLTYYTSHSFASSLHFDPLVFLYSFCFFYVPFSHSFCFVYSSLASSTLYQTHYFVMCLPLLWF
ncbi:hypothetical protein RIF29_41363 [Crotalaria pallida]|uniref:Uncharacterized protein n=1 Tax=Crotalaria pallida TaxID=3830 RepID=A0AAN9HRG3_CROPI